MNPTYLNTSKWRPLPPKGKTPHHTMFNPADSTYCALGLYFKAQGVSDIALAQCGYLEELARFGVEIPEGLTGNVAVTIMEYSDEQPDRRFAMLAIADTFRKAGIDVRWA